MGLPYGNPSGVGDYHTVIRAQEEEEEEEEKEEEEKEEKKSKPRR